MAPSSATFRKPIFGSATSRIFSFAIHLTREDEHDRERAEQASGASVPAGRLRRLGRIRQRVRLGRQRGGVLVLGRSRGRGRSRRRGNHGLGAGDQEAAAGAAELGQARQTGAVGLVGVGIVGLVVGEARHAGRLQVGDDDAGRAPPRLEQRIVECLVALEEVDRRLPGGARQRHRIAVLGHEDEDVAHEPCPIQAAPSR